MVSHKNKRARDIPSSVHARERSLDVQGITFTQLVKEHLRFVGKSLVAMGVCDADVDDAVQEVFLTARDKLDTYRERGALRSWLWAICRNVSLATRRRRARRQEYPIETDERTDEFSEEYFDRRRRVQRSVEALECLTDEQREVFVLYEVHQLPMRIVAETVGCPLQTAYSRHHAARDRLRACVLCEGGALEPSAR